MTQRHADIDFALAQDRRSDLRRYILDEGFDPDDRDDVVRFRQFTTARLQARTAAVRRVARMLQPAPGYNPAALAELRASMLALADTIEADAARDAADRLRRYDELLKG